jgi:uncharacterized LabA/DUF88 family protein
VAAFIDGSNIYYTMRDTLRWEIDWRRFRSFLERFGTVVDCIYYVGVTDDPAHQGFLGMLTYNGYSLVTKDLKTIATPDGVAMQKANLDVEIAVDMLARMGVYDAAVLASGDGDMLRAVQYVRDRSKEVYVLSTAGRVAQELRWLAGPNFLDLDHYRADLERGRAGPAEH